ncbi:hypothetical protein TNCV_4042091 [Trichonephila clavipes]|nr:hypothetical protein TNCV_4042091 [Trichonephila clavipes]
MNSWPACHEFKPSTSEDPPYGERRCTLNLPRLKHPTIDVMGSLRGVSSAKESENEYEETKLIRNDFAHHVGTPIEADLWEQILKLGPYQPEGNFQKDAKGRSFSSSYYSFISKAGQKIERKWLCYSTRLHVAYCQCMSYEVQLQRTLLYQPLVVGEDILPDSKLVIAENRRGFQQDGATCHTARATIYLLKDTFGDRLISRFGPVNWPPRSCDLTPLDYFLWGYVKSLVYADKPQTLDHLEDNIRRVIADIRPQMLEKFIENWTSRLDYIRASRGSHMPEIIYKM